MKLFFYNKYLSINNLYVIDKKSFFLKAIWFILLGKRKDYEELIDECNLYNKIMNLTGEATLYGLFPVFLYCQLIMHKWPIIVINKFIL